MTWIDNIGEVRPQSWEEYCAMQDGANPPDWRAQRLNRRPRSWAEYCNMVQTAPDWPTTQRLMRQYHSLFDGNEPPLKERLPRIPSEYRPSPKRARLFRANPHCFWCGCKVALEFDPPNRRDLATIDHLYSRLHPERAGHRATLVVLACRACNHERSRAESQRRPFVPRLKDKLRFAQQADATLARKEPIEEVKQQPPMRVICTIEEAIAFARENPSR